jgi:RHS repeat-associated protein
MPVTTFKTVAGRVLAQNKGGVYTRLVHDPLGSVIGTSTSAGVVSNRTTYWPYGEVRTGGVSAVTPFGFCGGWGYYTDSSGSLYVRARYYRPSLTRWQIVDPLWPYEMVYAYSMCAPPHTVDSSGMSPSKCSVMICTSLSNPFHHMRICATPPTRGWQCHGQAVPAGAVIDISKGECEKEPGDTCIIVSTDCDYAKRVCDCIRKSHDWSYVKNGVCWRYTHVMRCCGCDALKGPAKSKCRKDTGCDPKPPPKPTGGGVFDCQPQVGKDDQCPPGHIKQTTGGIRIG